MFFGGGERLYSSSVFLISKKELVHVLLSHQGWLPLPGYPWGGVQKYPYQQTASGVVMLFSCGPQSLRMIYTDELKENNKTATLPPAHNTRKLHCDIPQKATTQAAPNSLPLHHYILRKMARITFVALACGMLGAANAQLAVYAPAAGESVVADR